MAVFTRTNGDAAGVTNVDAGRSFANAAVINTGIAAPLSFYNITLAAGAPSGSYGNLAAELTTGGAVETIIRAIEGNATVLAYQVDANGQISVLVEAIGSNAATIQTRLQACNGGTTGNIGIAGNIWSGGGVTVSSANGFKLA